MNRFLSSDSNSNVVVQQTATTAVTDSSVTDALLERIHVLEYVSFRYYRSAYHEMALRKFAEGGMTYPAWFRISTSTHVLGQAGSAITTAAAHPYDCWQMVPSGGSNYMFASSTGTDLQQHLGTNQLKIITTDGGESFHICSQDGAEVWIGDFIELDA